MARWSLAPKRSILVHFSWIYHQKSTFLLILAPFLSEAVEDSRCYFFEDWFMKLKIYNLLKPLGTITQQNYWSFYPSELIYFAFFTMRHPVHLRAVASKGLRGLKPHPPVFGRSVNPISTRGAHSPHPVLWTPRIFRPCDGPVYISAGMQ